HVLLHVRRELDEKRPEVRPERSRGAEQVIHGILYVLEPLVVRDPLRRLENEREVLRHFGGPALERRQVRHAIKRVVHLDRREMPGVVAKHVLRRQLLGIEVSLPFLVRPAARSRSDPHACSWVQATGAVSPPTLPWYASARPSRRPEFGRSASGRGSRDRRRPRRGGWRGSRACR